MAMWHRRKKIPVFLPELKCSKSDAHFVLRDGAAGLFMAPAHSLNHAKHERHWLLNYFGLKIGWRKTSVSGGSAQLLIRW